jgi:signal transduction histidine kinase
MGLGLSIVKGIIEGHGGDIAETGAPGQGATFLILLPSAESLSE